MSTKVYRLLLAAAALCTGVVSFAQSGEYTGYTAYSVFGIGDIHSMGGSSNAALGGTGIATRSHKVLNYLNPAAVTARDSLSFMADIGMFQGNTISTQGGSSKANNITNINDIVISFPIYKGSAMIIGITPYSSSGYSFSTLVTDPLLIGSAGAISNNSAGQGTTYKLFVAAGVTLFDHLSLGLEFDHHFGDITRSNYNSFSDASYRSIRSGYNIDMYANSIKLGAQYERRVNGMDMVAGATYKTSAALKGHVTDYIMSGSTQIDTTRYNVDTLSRHGSDLKLASELGLGFSIGVHDRWRAEVNYIFSDWSGTGFDKTVGFRNVSGRSFSTTACHSLRAGFEYTPNINDIRYYLRRCTYKAGVYHNQMYYKLDGHDISATGITLGVTLPIFRLNNGLTVGVDMGQKGTTRSSLIRERYINFTIGLNAFDLWFQKPRYN